MKQSQIIQKYLFFFFSSFCLLFSQASFGFSEAEIDSLESTGGKRVSSSLWRTELGFSLQRNLLFNARLVDNISANTEASFFDLSNLYYGTDLNINYSLKDFDFLKNTEVFLKASFNSPVKGHKSNLLDYGPMKYISYALGDLVAGLTSPLKKGDNFLSYFDTSVILFPLSRFSREASLITTLDETISFLRFLKKEESWKLAVSASHNMAYSLYTSKDADKGGYKKNIPFDLSHGLGLFYRQNYSKFIPFSTRVFASHYFGINTYHTQTHFLTLGSSFTWKTSKKVYINFLIRWRDNIHKHNPKDHNIKKTEKVSFNLRKIFFTLRGIYSF